MAKKTKLERHPQDDVNENLQEIPKDAPEDVKEFLQGETDELPEGAEEITEEEATELEEKTEQNPVEKYIKENLEDTDAGSDQVSDQVNEEVKAEPVDEQKKYVKKKECILNDIKELEEKNVVLEKEAEKFENLASTMDTEPFVELKSLVKETIKTYTDRNDIKEVKKKIKNFEAIVSMENLLNEYKDLADENRQNIVANNNDIKNYKEKLEEVESKITCFQTKLGLWDNAETGEGEA